MWSDEVELPAQIRPASEEVAVQLCKALALCRRRWTDEARKQAVRILLPAIRYERLIEVLKRSRQPARRRPFSTVVIAPHHFSEENEKCGPMSTHDMAPIF